jgi:hypothetical protein
MIRNTLIMKNYVLAFIILLATAPFLMNSCDKVEFPNIPIEGVDTTLYPGNFSEYTIPSFSENSNTLRNALIEDFTGHQCQNCPAAADVAKELEENNPGRAFVASIHAGPSNNGITTFQEVSPPKYDRDFTTPEGREMGSTFFQLGVGFVGNPRGNVSRIRNESGEFMFTQSSWPATTAEVLASPVSINLQAKSNYYEETNGVFLHVETDFEQNMEGTYNLVVYALQNEIIDYQKYYSEETGNIDSAYYHHHNVHLGNVFGETWGRTVGSEQISAGTKVVTDMSYKVPDGLTNEDMHFLVMVIDRNTYEVMQVIKHEF